MGIINCVFPKRKVKIDHCAIDIVMTLKNCQNKAITSVWFGCIFLRIIKFFLKSREGCELGNHKLTLG